MRYWEKRPIVAFFNVVLGLSISQAAKYPYGDFQFGGTGKKFWSRAVRVNSYAKKSQYSPDVAIDNLGNIFVVWEGEPNCWCPWGNDDTEVFGQLFNSNGDMVTEELVINDYHEGPRGSVRVAAGPNGKFAVAWAGWIEEGRGGYRISAQILNSLGERIGDNFLVSRPEDLRTHTYCEVPDIAFNRKGGMVIAWEGTDASWFQIFDEQGKRLGENRIIGENEAAPKVAVAPDGSFVVITFDRNHDPAPDATYYNRILLRRYTPEGALIGTPVPVDPGPCPDFENYGVAMDGEGNFLVIWVCWDGPEFGPNWTGIFGQKFSRDGHPIGNKFRVNLDPRCAAAAPAVAMDKNGNFVVVWQQGCLFPECAPGPYLAQRFNANNERVGHEFEVGSGVSAPKISMNDEGRFVVVWHKGIVEGDDVVARVFEFDAVDFIRGDANRDGMVDISDAIAILLYLFAGYELDYPDAADTDDSGYIEISDVVYLLGHLVANNPCSLPRPFPFWGFDTTPDDL